MFFWLQAVKPMELEAGAERLVLIPPSPAGNPAVSSWGGKVPDDGIQIQRCDLLVQISNVHLYMYI